MSSDGGIRADDLSTSGYGECDTQRFVGEPAKRSGRTAFARDRARVLHSSALRRLAAKTQVFIAGKEDFPRTRLTHTIEVAQIARELGQSLGCDPDVVDVAGLAHDLGHPPFGHNGETALAEAADWAGGFEGNAQSFRVLTRLESKTFDADGRSLGLNLTRAALDASTKYPWPRREGMQKFGVYEDDMDIFQWVREGAPGEQKCMEAQIMDWADDVAYSVHDLEDAVHMSHLDLRDLSSVEGEDPVIAVARRTYARDADLEELRAALRRVTGLPYWPTSYDASQKSLAALKNLTSQLIGRFCMAVERATRDAYGSDPLTRYSANLVIPREARLEVAVMKSVTAHYVMWRPGAEDVYAAQRGLLQELVAQLVSRDGRDLEPWLAPAYAAATDDAQRLRVVIDQVASLTDVSAVEWHERLGSR